MLAAERGDGLRPELLVLLRHREAIAAAGSNVEELSAIAPARRSRPDLMRRQREEHLPDGVIEFSPSWRAIGKPRKDAGGV